MAKGLGATRLGRRATDFRTGTVRYLRGRPCFYPELSVSLNDSSFAEGVSEVASVGGFIKEYQVDVQPEALKAFGVSVMDVMNAVKKSNLDIGAETIELNDAEYIIRGLGYVAKYRDWETDRKSTRLNSSHRSLSRMPSSA